MLYEDYEEYKNKYYAAQNEYSNILNEKEELFRITQPQATDYSKERISGGKPVNAFDEYLSKKEKKNIDARLSEALSILQDRKMLLDLKEEELRLSKDWNDLIYAYRYIDKLSIRNIERRIPFSRSEICRKIRIIKNNIEVGTK